MTTRPYDPTIAATVADALKAGEDVAEAQREIAEREAKMKLLAAKPAGNA